MYPQSFEKECVLRKQNIVSSLTNGEDAILVSDNANLFYTSGRVFNGYTYITALGEELFFVKRPVGLNGDNVIYIRKPEQILEELEKRNIALPKTLALELNSLSYSEALRLQKAFNGVALSNGSAIMQKVRSQKTDYEIALLKQCGELHAQSYAAIPALYKEGMTDIDLQIEIERKMRQLGNLGQFRIAGQSMEIFMGNLICGDNADNPTPYDFAMGGAGLDLSLPVGCNGTRIESGMTIMVDLGGNFNGYMTDMTRVFTLGKVDELAKKCHDCSIEICNHIKAIGLPGVEAKHLYEEAVRIANEAGLQDYFMGYTQKAGFIGHGVGIEINELPVLAPRSKHILQEGNVIAVEPKFVVPHVGAAGVENTYVVTSTGMEQITNAPMEMLPLEG